MTPGAQEKLTASGFYGLGFWGLGLRVLGFRGLGTVG